MQSMSSMSIRALSSAARPSKKRFSPVIFSGIQPSGTPHLGNYLGLFLPFLELQKNSPPEVPIYLSIVGLHAITLPRDPKVLRQDRKDMLAALIACGVDVERTCLYFQEDAAADDDLEVIPVGEDQAQHLELAKYIADAFNRAYGEIFPIPEPLIVPSKRILSLRDPSAKMSKSAPNAASRILITDSASQITSKIKAAVTDSEPHISYDPETRPGAANLLLIWSALDPAQRTPAQLAEEVKDWRFGKLKETIAEVVVEHLRPFREEYERIRVEDGWLSEVARKGREKASINAKSTMEEVRRTIGLDRL